MNNHNKLYIGSVTRDGSLVRVKSGNAEDQLPLCLNIRNHSPTGFAWGYGGSGPAQLSLAILVDHFRGRVSNAGTAQEGKKPRLSSRGRGSASLVLHILLN